MDRRRRLSMSSTGSEPRHQPEHWRQAPHASTDSGRGFPQQAQPERSETGDAGTKSGERQQPSQPATAEPQGSVPRAEEPASPAAQVAAAPGQGSRPSEPPQRLHAVPETRPLGSSELHPG